MKKYLFIIALCLSGCNGTNAENGTGEEHKKLDSPSGVVCTSATENSLTFTWQAVSGAENYTYRLQKGMTLTESRTISDTEVTVSGLEAGATYRFSVKCSNSKTSSEYSDIVEASTKEGESTGGDNGNSEKPDQLANVYDAMKMPEAENDGKVRAFPGAEGGGMYTAGGRGGKVLHVTTLEDSNKEGTLRWAVSQKYPRTIVFDVAGTITLKSPLKITSGQLTIAGQTAPGDGICLKGRYTQVDADDVIIRFVRFRLGDEDPNASDSDDAIYCRYHKNVILDHCSMSWSIDECASFYANANTTMQWCFLAESMKRSSHNKGDHGYGGIWGGSNVSFHHNILAHHDSRNPRFDHPHIYNDHNKPENRGVIDFRNNIVYDWGSNNSYGGEGYGAGKGVGINMVGNTYKPGPSSSDRKYFIDAYSIYSKCSSCGTNLEEGYPLLYMSGNVHTKYSDISADNSTGIKWHNDDSHPNYGKTSTTAFPVVGPDGQTCYTTTHSATEAFKAVCDFGGASLRRDKVDERVSSDVTNGKGKIIDCVSATDGKVSVAGLYAVKWPALSASDSEKAIASTDSDKDGIPDYYEYLFGLDPKNPDDALAKSIDKFGRYTNLEMYLHYLVRDIVEGGNKNGTYTSL